MAVLACDCHRCGPVRVPAHTVRVLVCTAGGVDQAAFRCPLCHAAGARPLGALERHSLGVLGVEVVPWEPPAELDDPDRDPAVTFDESDVEEAAEALVRIRGVDDFLAEATRRRP